MRKVLLVAAVIAMTPFVSQATTLDELLADKGIAQNEVRAGSDAAKLYWNKGTRIEFPDTGFTTSVSTVIRTRYEFVDNDEGADNTSSVDVKNARLVVEGTALNREFSYLLRTELAGSSAELLDGYISWDACDTASVQIGQFKPAVSRQFNTDEPQLQLADRSVVSDTFDLGRHQGIQVGLKGIEGASVAFQVFDGDGANVNNGVDTDHVYAAALRVPLTGELDAYSEGDVENTEELAADIGAAYAYADLGSEDYQVVSADVNVKSNGLSVHGEVFWDDDSATGNSDTGGYVQVGYFLTAKELEVAGRYGILDCESGLLGCTGNDSVNEATVGLNYYWWAHHLKAQVGYSFLNEDTLAGDDVNTNRWLVQLGGWF